MVPANLTLRGSNYLTFAQQVTSPNQLIFPITAQVNSQDHLTIGGCDIVELVQNFGSPLYILDEETLRLASRQYRDSLLRFYPGKSQVIYASKAWSSLAICAIIASEGIGFDVVSGGELYTTLMALETIGLKDKAYSLIYFHGNNKSLNELSYAIENQCTIIVDNWWELEALESLAQEPVKIMLRLTPGIECHTHEYIRTGSLDSKFGFDPNQFEQLFSYVSQHKKLNCVGLHAHIGSQIFEKEPHQDLTSVLVKSLQSAKEHGLEIDTLNIGGGLGIRYTESDDPPSIVEWVEAVSKAMIDACTVAGVALPKLMIEPGRSLIATACVTAYTVGSSKEIPGIRNYIAVDGGMSDNPRPITYQSLYRVVLANGMSENAQFKVTIAGKHCESGDILIKDAALPATSSGDILVVPATGAYNSSMSSNYNRLPRPAAVLVNQGEANLIVKRETYMDLVKQDVLPERLSNHQS
jgi:diaminopimelate decarboxylase